MRAQVSLMKPGTASFLIAKSGTHHEWMTSSAVSRKRTFLPLGSTSGLSTALR